MVKKILLAVFVVMCCGAVLVGGAWCSAQKDDSPCTAVQVVVRDSMQRQFVQADELEGYLKRHRLYPLALMMQQVDCHAIEQCLLSHDMVRCAEWLAASLVKAGADRVELYTGPYAEVYEHNPAEAIAMYRGAAEKAHELGIGLNAGHDLNLKNLSAFVQAFPWVDEVSIGQALIADALYLGIEETIKQYKYALSNSN